ncbi:universal stress protein [Piscinibacter sp. XHJ-5]|uniref:universal stress protein n=1 Tax=Piscinibacter sp. XHJ-5 TaxID=3037797 RepID=UPI0024528E5D|nr:universal stress protein [Piscinibacter sp. XHJ-5]
MYPRILVPLDGSETSERGLREAVRLAARNDVTLVLLHVIDDFPTVRQLAASEPIEQLEARRRKAGEELLSHAEQLAHAADVQTESIACLAVESVPDSILETAHKTGCELIVLGTHGRSGVRRAVLGSVAERVSRHSPVPVMLVPPAS